MMDSIPLTRLVMLVSIVVAVQLVSGAPTTVTSPHLAFRLVAPAEADRDDPAIEMLHDPFTKQMIPVRREVLLDETAIAKVTYNKSDRTIYLEMTPEGAQTLERVTRDNIGRKLAIVLNGSVLVAPHINSAVSKAVAISLSPSAGEDEVKQVAIEIRKLVERVPATGPTTQP
jgi:preprotein translocase subunit SecD